MERKHIITLSGKPGSGKSSTADRVAELLGYARYSSGDFVRAVIKKHKMSLSEFNQQATENHALDHEIDEQLRELRDQKDIVVDSRLGFYWMPESFKVYLDLDMEVAIARIYKDIQGNTKRQETENAGSISDIQALVKSRVKNEQDRFRELYGINPYGRDHFDLIINTSRHTPESVALTVHDHYKKWLQSETWKQVVSEIPLGYTLQ